MAYYYKIQSSEKTRISVAGIQAYYTDSNLKESPNELCAKFDFTKYVLIELLDNVTPEEKLWEELGLTCKTRIIHKRLMVDAHRVHCRRAIIICIDSEEAKYVAQRLSQTKIFKRCVCAAVVQDLLSDISLFEKQIINFGDKRSQEKLIYVTDLSIFREPESQAQYLQKLFSPFGKILSILVAKGKNRYANPEGVISFSHLSEAFAAELAYDQCVVGLERLSVTVHHNILLSQCDLRMRLKEAQVKNESINDTSFVESKHILESKYAQNGTLFPLSTFCSRNKGKSSLISETNHYKSDVMRCLDYLAISSNFSTKSVNETQNVRKCNNVKDAQISEKLCLIDDSLVNTVPLPEKSIISNSSINSTDMSNLSSSEVELTYPLNSSVEESSISKMINDNNLAGISLKSENPTSANNKHAEGVFIHSALSSDNRLLNKSLFKNKELLKVSNLTSPKVCQNCRMRNDCKCSRKTLPCNSGNCDVTSFSDNLDVNCLSETKKKFSLSQKLSLKKQRFRSVLFPYEISSDETTMILPTTCVSEDHNVTPKCKSVESRRDDSQIMKPCFHTCQSFENTTLDFNQRIDKEHLNDVQIRNGSKFSKMAFCQQNATRKEQKSKLRKECPLEFVTIPSYNKNVDSPLKTWLKEELIFSTNNKVADCTKNSRKIVCATLKREILVPVGCSNMTCNFCYPRSTNLLFGFY